MRKKLVALSLATILAASTAACGSAGNTSAIKTTEQNTEIATETTLGSGAEQTLGTAGASASTDESGAAIGASTEADDKTASADKTATAGTTSTGATKTGATKTGTTNNGTTSTGTTNKGTTGATDGNSNTNTDKKKTDTTKKTDGSTGSTTATTEAEKECNHKWVAQYKTVHHDAVTHKEKVLVDDEWDEGVYATHVFCNGCGMDLTAAGLKTAGQVADHVCECHGGTGYHSSQVQVDTIHHDATYETVTITDKAAYDEKVLTGYKCSHCGKTKSK